MLLSKIVTRAPLARMQPQRRGILDYLTKYPDKVMEQKKIQMAGGTKLGEANPTWLKQSGDMGMIAIAGGLAAFGLFHYVVGVYRLATGKGKLD